MGGVGTVSRYLLITIIPSPVPPPGHLVACHIQPVGQLTTKQDESQIVTSLTLIFPNCSFVSENWCVEQATVVKYCVILALHFTFYKKLISSAHDPWYLTAGRGCVTRHYWHQQVGSAGSGQDLRTGRQFAVIWSLKCSDILLLMLSVVRAAVLWPAGRDSTERGLIIKHQAPTSRTPGTRSCVRRTTGISTDLQSSQYHHWPDGSVPDWGWQEAGDWKWNSRWQFQMWTWRCNDLIR